MPMLASEMQFDGELKAKLSSAPSPEIPSADVSAVTTSNSDGSTSPSISSPVGFAMRHAKVRAS